MEKRADIQEESKANDQAAKKSWSDLEEEEEESKDTKYEIIM
jgi:hypothetical protein